MLRQGRCPMVASVVPRPGYRVEAVVVVVPRPGCPAAGEAGEEEALRPGYPGLLRLVCRAYRRRYRRCLADLVNTRLLPRAAPSRPS